MTAAGRPACRSCRRSPAYGSSGRRSGPTTTDRRRWSGWIVGGGRRSALGFPRSSCRPRARSYHAVVNPGGVRAGLALLHELGPEAILEWLDPDVEMLGPRPSPWDCHGRDQVVRFLAHFEPGGTRLEITETTDFGDQVLLGTRRRQPDGFVQNSFSVVSFREGRVILMRGYPTRDQALAELEQ